MTEHTIPGRQRASLPRDPGLYPRSFPRAGDNRHPLEGWPWNPALEIERPPFRLPNDPRHTRWVLLNWGSYRIRIRNYYAGRAA